MELLNYSYWYFRENAFKSSPHRTGRTLESKELSYVLNDGLALFISGYLYFDEGFTVGSWVSL